MPRIPTYNVPQVGLQPTQTGNVQAPSLDPVNFTGGQSLIGVGEALSRLGGGALQIGGQLAAEEQYAENADRKFNLQLDQYYQQINAKKAVASAKAATNQFYIRGNEKLAEYLKTRGADGASPDAYKQFNDYLDQQRQELTKGLNQTAQDLAANDLERMASTFRVSASQHYDRELDDYNKNESTAKLGRLADELATRAMNMSVTDISVDPKNRSPAKPAVLAYGELLVLMDKELDDYQNYSKSGAEEHKQFRDKYLEAVHSNIVDKFMEAGRVEEAAMYLQFTGETIQDPKRRSSRVATISAALQAKRLDEMEMEVVKQADVPVTYKLPMPDGTEKEMQQKSDMVVVARSFADQLTAQGNGEMAEQLMARITKRRNEQIEVQKIERDKAVQEASNYLSMMKLAGQQATLEQFAKDQPELFARVHMTGGMKGIDDLIKSPTGKIETTERGAEYMKYTDDQLRGFTTEQEFQAFASGQLSSSDYNQLRNRWVAASKPQAVSADERKSVLDDYFLTDQNGLYTSVPLPAQGGTSSNEASKQRELLRQQIALHNDRVEARRARMTDYITTEAKALAGPNREATAQDYKAVIMRLRTDSSIEDKVVLRTSAFEGTEAKEIEVVVPSAALAPSERQTARIKLNPITEQKWTMMGRSVDELSQIMTKSGGQPKEQINARSYQWDLEWSRMNPSFILMQPGSEPSPPAMMRPPAKKAISQIIDDYVEYEYVKWSMDNEDEAIRLMGQLDQLSKQIAQDPRAERARQFIEAESDDPQVRKGWRGWGWTSVPEIDSWGTGSRSADRAYATFYTPEEIEKRSVLMDQYFTAQARLAELQNQPKKKEKK